MIQDNGDLEYQAASPDEVALVKWTGVCIVLQVDWVLSCICSSRTMYAVLLTHLCLYTAKVGMVLLSRGLHDMQVQGPDPDAPPLSYEVACALLQIVCSAVGIM